MSKALDGKFFWEPTSAPNETSLSKEVLDIRAVQRQFARGAKQITARRQKAVAVIANTSLEGILDTDDKEVARVVQAVAKAYNVSTKDLFGKSTSYLFAKAKRHLSWALIKYIPCMSYPEAARILGKNHTTVLSGKQKFDSCQDFEKVVEVERLMGLL